jgi:hypothetical protein
VACGFGETKATRGGERSLSAAAVVAGTSSAAMVAVASCTEVEVLQLRALGLCFFPRMEFGSVVAGYP